MHMLFSTGQRMEGREKIRYEKIDGNGEFYVKCFLGKFSATDRT